MNNGTVSISTLASTTKELMGILDSLKAGDTISADDYQKLIDSELGLENYFTLMYDGTYKLCDAALNFESILKGEYVKRATQAYQADYDLYTDLNDRVQKTNEKMGWKEYDQNNVKDMSNINVNPE